MHNFQTETLSQITADWSLQLVSNPGMNASDPRLNLGGHRRFG